MLANDPHRQAPNKLRLKTKLHKIAGLHRFQRPLFVGNIPGCRREADGRIPQPFANNFLQSAESAAHHEQNVPGVDDCGLLLSTPLGQVHHRLNLAGNIIGRASRDFSFLHQF